MFEDSDRKWGEVEDDFLVFILDTKEKEWIDGRIKKRIREMVCDEGGLEECFEVILRILGAKIQEKNEEKKLIFFMEELNNIEAMYTKGVMQSIGYKEFVELFRKEAKMVFEEEKKFSKFSEKMKKRASEIAKEYDSNTLLKQSVDKLAKDTIMLTKKQRKWIKNRIYTVPELNKKSFLFYVKSKEQFFEEILPKAKNILDDYLSGKKSIEVLNDEY